MWLHFSEKAKSIPTLQEKGKGKQKKTKKRGALLTSVKAGQISGRFLLEGRSDELLMNQGWKQTVAPIESASCKAGLINECQRTRPNQRFRASAFSLLIAFSRVHRPE